MTDVLDAVTAAVDGAVGLEATSLDAATLGRVARRVTREIARLEGVRARVVRAADDSGVVSASGASSPAAWLADETGGSTGAAARVASLGRAMDEVPSLADAVDHGRIGTEQASAIARAADRGVLDRDQLGGLVDDASRLPAGAFSRVVTSTEARTDQARLRCDEAFARERRSARWWRNEDGTVQGSFRLDAVAGETLVTALDAMTVLDPADVPDDRRRTPAQRGADAFTALARSVLDRGEGPVVRTVKPHVTVTVPVSMLTATDDEAEAAGALGTLPDGTVVSAETARRLLCDATVRRLVLDPDGQPLDVGRATRTWSASQRAALDALDGGCRGPACDRPTTWTEAHHVVWWRNRGTTAIGNGLLLCGHCHDLVHHAGWTVRLDPTTRDARWTSPTGHTTTTHARGSAARRR